MTRKGVVTAATAVVLLVACSPTDTTAGTSVPQPGPVSTMATPTSPAPVPTGWGVRPPTEEEAAALLGWADQYQENFDKVVKDATAVLERRRLDPPGGSRRVSDVKADCNDIAETLMGYLTGAGNQAPDPDLAKGLNAMADAGAYLYHVCPQLSDPPTAQQLTDLAAGVKALSESLRYATDTLKRDEQLMMKALGFG